MSFIGSMFGVKGTQIDRPVTTQQAQTAYDQTQQGLQQQQAFLQALQGQGGLQNQSSVFGQQQNLANMMQDLAAGTGPNPALAGLNKATGQNIAAMTSAMAGGRGASANPAAIARSAGRAGAESLQTAAADAATVQAQQQIAGMDALSRQQQAMGNMANTQVANQAAATNAYSTSAQNQQQNLLSGINAQNQANVAMQSNLNQANAALGSAVIGGIAGGAGAGMQKMGATGGRVKRHQIGDNLVFADGGLVNPDQVVQRTNLPAIDGGGFSMPSGDFDTSAITQGLKDLGAGIGSRFKKKEAPASSVSGGGGGAMSAHLTNMMATGGKVPAMVSPGEKYLTPEQARDVLKGKENPLNGKTIPGKAKVKGDSYANDTVPVTLEEGGCVIPRSVLQSDQPMKNAIKFVHEHMKKMAKGGKVENKKQPKQENIKIVEDDMFEPKATPEALEKMGAKPFIHPKVAKDVLASPHVLFSPGNPLYPVSAKMTPDEVLEFVKDHGLIAEPAIGKYGDVEPSIMVHNVKRNQLPFLFELAKKLGQESIIHSEGGNHEAHYLNGPNTGKIARGVGTAIHEKEPENFYTKTKNGLIFSHDIDWENLHDK